LLLLHAVCHAHDLSVDLHVPIVYQYRSVLNIDSVVVLPGTIGNVGPALALFKIFLCSFVLVLNVPPV
jgi:hypothetical protein